MSDSVPPSAGDQLDIMASEPTAADLEARTRIFAETDAEMVRQDAQWGQQNHPDVRGTVAELQDDLGLPTADMARVVCDQAFADGVGTWAHIFVEEAVEAVADCDDPVLLRAELIQAAAVALQWVAAIDRRSSAG